MGKKFHFIVMIVGFIFAIALAGCSESSSLSNSNASEQSASNRDELVLAVGSEPETGFDPTTGWGRYGSPLFQSTLLKRDNDLKIMNDLATGYEVSKDGLTWIVELRKGVKFSDGQPLTAADVQYTFEEASTSGSVLDLQVMKKVETLDDYKVKFTLVQAQSTFVNLLVTTGIVPKHAHSKEYAEKPIGSGPYQLIQWDKGQQLIVQANPEYYDTKPVFQKITFLFLNEDAAFAAAKTGKVDVAYIPASFSNQEMPGMRLESVKTIDNRGIMFPFVKSGEKTEDGFLIGNDVTADPAIRKGINVAIDREALVDGVLDGYGAPAYTIVDGLPWWNPETVIQDADMEKAKKILEDAGWIDKNGDGILDKGSMKAEFTLLYPADDVTRQSLAISTADMLKPLGINILVKGESWDNINSLQHSNAVLFGWGSHDPLEMYNVYSSKSAGIDNYNAGFYHNSIVDEYMEKALAATNEEDATKNWKKAQWDGTTGLSSKGDAAWAWLVNIDHLYLVNDHLSIGKQRIHPHGHGWPVTDNIVEWRWNE